MAREVSQYVRSCSVCAITKTPHHLPAGKLMPLPIPHRPWSHVGVDFVTDLPNSEGFTCILVAVDQFSKACRLIPLKGLPTALETAEALFQHVFRNFGIPEDIVSDVGPSSSRMFGRPSSNSWASQLASPLVITPRPMARLSGRYRRLGNTSGHTATPTSTAGAASSHGPSMHRTPLNKPPPASPHSSAYSVSNPLYSPGPKNPPMFQLWTTGSERAREFGTQLISTSNRQCGDIKPLQMPAGPTPPPIYHPGDKVWLSTQDLRLRLPCKKLSPRYIGPFTILRQINEVTFHLQLPAPYRIHPVFHVSLLKSFYPSAPDPNEPGVPPPPEVLAEPTIYRVRNIMDSRRRGGHLEYFIDWEGYGPEERSWVARDDVLDPSLLADSTRTTLTALLPEAMAVPVVALGRQEPPLEEGVLSESHSHYQPCSPDHNHLSTNHATYHHSA